MVKAYTLRDQIIMMSFIPHVLVHNDRATPDIKCQQSQLAQHGLQMLTSVDDNVDLTSTGLAPINERILT